MKFTGERNRTQITTISNAFPNTLDHGHVGPESGSTSTNGFIHRIGIEKSKESK
ncbi:MAG: hypothetical protein GY696_04210 [Gammaproteobacteria bacterium]|nr:hypothetical protein [Gammaproteobacteria bacterium]